MEIRCRCGSLHWLYEVLKKSEWFASHIRPRCVRTFRLLHEYNTHRWLLLVTQRLCYCVLTPRLTVGPKWRGVTVHNPQKAVESWSGTENITCMDNADDDGGIGDHCRPSHLARLSLRWTLFQCWITTFFVDCSPLRTTYLCGYTMWIYNLGVPHAYLGSLHFI